MVGDWTWDGIIYYGWGLNLRWDNLLWVGIEPEMGDFTCTEFLVGVNNFKLLFDGKLFIYMSIQKNIRYRYENLRNLYALWVEPEIGGFYCSCELSMIFCFFKTISRIRWHGWHFEFGGFYRNWELNLKWKFHCRRELSLRWRYFWTRP